MVIKSDNRRQPFDRQKLSKGIERAMEKRPISSATIETIILEIEDQAILENKATNEITTSRLGELVLNKLYEVDKVAYVRFASVYRHFENIDEIIKEVKKLESEEKKSKKTKEEQ